MTPSVEQVGRNSDIEQEQDLLKTFLVLFGCQVILSHLLHSSWSTAATSSLGQEIMVMVAKPTVATVPINTDQPARVFGAKRYLVGFKFTL